MGRYKVSGAHYTTLIACSQAAGATRHFFAVSLVLASCVGGRLHSFTRTQFA